MALLYTEGTTINYNNTEYVASYILVIIYFVYTKYQKAAYRKQTLQQHVLFVPVATYFSNQTAGIRAGNTTHRRVYQPERV